MEIVKNGINNAFSSTEKLVNLTKEDLSYIYMYLQNKNFGSRAL